MELDLKLFLEKYSGTTVDFFRFNGNYGDSLIWHGTIKLLTQLGIDVNYVDLNSSIKNEILFIDGGGNFVDYYSDVSDFLSKKHHLYKEIVIFPHTINGEKQKLLLGTFGENITVFCREKRTYNFVTEHAKNCHIYLWHDCAFNNNFDAYKRLGAGVLNAFRDDCESVQKSKPKDNFDISSNGYCKKPLETFLEEIAKYNEIKTDRLHVAIAATLLGKKVKLYSNSYFKNKAVYEYSLKKFQNITFIENE